MNINQHESFCNHNFLLPGSVTKSTREHKLEKWSNPAILLTETLGKTTNKQQINKKYRPQKKQIYKQKTGNISLPISLFIFQRVRLLFCQRTLGFPSVFIYGQSNLSDCHNRYFSDRERDGNGLPVSVLPYGSRQ